jgi:hypothetical protein
MILSQSEQGKIFDEAQKNKKAFAVDWDFGAEDVAFNIKEIIPTLDINGEKAVQVLGDWIETLTIEGKEYKFNLDSETKPIDIVNKANLHLKNIGKTLVFYDTKDEDYSFILINLSELPDYLEKGFIEV